MNNQNIKFNSKRAKNFKGIPCLLLLTAVFMQVKTVSAQLNPFSSMYFQNQYLTNPAMAGLDKGLTINLGVRQQWTNIPGSPKTQIISADYNAGKNVGLGFNVSNDQAGLLRQTRAVATYAYHVQLGGDNQKLNFGLSAGITDERINYSQVDGDQGDVQVDRYNQQRPYLDGDFGVSYTSNNLTVQGAIPNLNHFFKHDNTVLGVDRSVFMTSVSYKIALASLLDGSAIEPKLVFRRVYGYKDILDAGLNFTLKNEMLHFYTMYHSSQSESLGFGANINPNVQLMLFYTTETSALKTYTNGDLELGLKLQLATKKNNL
ncbi:PorP/SprF family type IX secretion system membrane protein [Mucilaginibacter arboris]|uniref:Type IX secretion system membrane protein PorP/SprF n=1 Tax=Mucilaginibacter arboris TaxID=2682090 RepID=A0A7K1SWW0_9SPHI|nr:PorP/SprF family type IX secretion system membrane protein [Mucilaginibacter arboris]MVN21799.1 type IX secretion system membrane protein PorP/SprF [Mucilaginibacter arboris]